MDTLKKINYLLDKKAKLQTVGLFFMILLGSFAELLGVSVLLPIVELAMNEKAGESFVFLWISRLTGYTTKEEILLFLICATIILYILKNLYLSWMNGEMYFFAANVKRRLATNLMQAYLEQPYAFFLYRNSSELIRSVNTDTASLYEVVVNCLLILSNGVTAVCLIVNLAVTNLVMTLVIAALLSFCAVLVLLIVQKRTRYYGTVNQRMSGFLIRHLQQAFDGIKEIKILNNERYFIDRYDDAYRRQTEVERKSKLVNLIPKYIIEAVCISGILAYLGVNILVNPEYAKLLPQLAIFSVTAYKLLPAVNSVYAYVNTIMYHRASIDLVYRDMKDAEALAESREVIAADAAEKLPLKEALLAEHLTFGYLHTERDVLTDVSFTIARGSSVALIGASGGGKTTTADILLGLLAPREGRILVDGRDIREHLRAWRRNIGYIPQSIYLTDDTIRGNVAFGIEEREISDAQVKRALKEAQLAEFVEGLPKKEYTEVGERGVRLSGGQRQRIGIARALYHDPEILIFDEATSALDNETEKELMRSIEGLRGSKTMLMIAHRLSTIESCDAVYRVENGRIEKVRG